MGFLRLTVEAITSAADLVGKNVGLSNVDISSRT